MWMMNFIRRCQNRSRWVKPEVIEVATTSHLEPPVIVVWNHQRTTKPIVNGWQTAPRLLFVNHTTDQQKLFGITKPIDQRWWTKGSGIRRATTDQFLVYPVAGVLPAGSEVVSLFFRYWLMISSETKYGYPEICCLSYRAFCWIAIMNLCVPLSNHLTNHWPTTVDSVQ